MELDGAVQGRAVYYGKQMKSAKPIRISDELAAKCDGPRQFKTFDALVGKLMSIPPGRAALVRQQATINPNPRGRPKASESRDRRVGPLA
jgi:hypothetical protein